MARMAQGSQALGHALSDYDRRGDRATGVEQGDLVSWRQVERGATFERAGHALALVVHHVRDPPDGDALTLLYRDVAVDRNAGRAGSYLRVLGIEDSQGEALQVPGLGIVVAYREVFDTAAFVGRLDLIQGHVGIARVVLDLHGREVEERLAQHGPGHVSLKEVGDHVLVAARREHGDERRDPDPELCRKRTVLTGLQALVFAYGPRVCDAVGEELDGRIPRAQALHVSADLTVYVETLWVAERIFVELVELDNDPRPPPVRFLEVWRHGLVRVERKRCVLRAFGLPLPHLDVLRGGAVGSLRGNGRFRALGGCYGGLALVAPASCEQEQAPEDEDHIHPCPRVRPSLALRSDCLLPCSFPEVLTTSDPICAKLARLRKHRNA